MTDYEIVSGSTDVELTADAERIEEAKESGEFTGEARFGAMGEDDDEE